MSPAPDSPRFYFGAMSPYSWFAAERIESLLPEARWHGVFAGAVFKQNDRESWGLTDEREATLADCEARAAEHGLGPIRWPDPWPTVDLLVARAMVFCMQDREHDALLRSFGLAAMRLSFLEGVDLGEADAVLEAGRRAGIEEQALAEALQSQQVKEALRVDTGRVVAAGVFGVPTVSVGEQLFWGDDRLEDAARLSRVARPRPTRPSAGQIPGRPDLQASQTQADQTFSPARSWAGQASARPDPVLLGDPCPD